MLKLNIFSQRLSYFSDSEVVADSKGYLAFTLETSEDWANYVGKTVQFTRDGKTYSVTNIMDNVEYAVPWEVLKGAGIMYVNAFAVASGGKRATTNQIAVEITASGLNEDSLNPSDPTPDIFQQYVEHCQEYANTAQKAAQSAKESSTSAKQSADRAQQYYQQTLTIKGDIESLNNQVNQAAQNAFQYSESAKQSAQAAAQSEIAAAASAADAKQYAKDAQIAKNNAKLSEENAKLSEENAKLSADKAEANQQIVTETKAEIDSIHENIKNISADVTEKHNDVVAKTNIVTDMHQQVENWYNNFITGVEYIEFTEQMQTEDTDGWVQVEDSQEYILSVADNSKMVMSVQILLNGTYYITPFCDIVFAGNRLELHAIAPFAGRVALHALISNTNNMEIQQ